MGRGAAVGPDRFHDRGILPVAHIRADAVSDLGLSAALAAIVRGADRSISLPALPELGMLVLACELGSIGVVYTMVKLHVA